MRASRAATVQRVGWVLAMGTLLASRGSAAEPFYLKGGERVVFFGDSITQAGQYITYVEAFLLTRFPEEQFTLINHGISSETISGTSEPDHRPRRPDAHARFARDVAAWDPDVVVACFGMNDGNYHPFDEERFSRYQDGVRRLIQRTRDEAHARLTLLTPPPFDPYRRSVGDPKATDYGYKFPAIDYDQTLGRYSDWLLSLRDEGVIVADVHAAMNDHLRRRREDQVSFFLAGDAVHPYATGHWLMAQTLLLAWHAPAQCAEARIDALALRVEAGEVRDLSRAGDGLRASWRTPLPMPIDPAWDHRSIDLERMADRLNRYRLTVTGLSAPRYLLQTRLAEETADVAVAAVSREQLAQGLDLTALPEFPTVRIGREVLSLLQAHRQAVDSRWRQRITTPDPADDQAETPEDAATMARIRQLCRPRDVLLRLVPADAAPPRSASPEALAPPRDVRGTTTAPGAGR